MTNREALEVIEILKGMCDFDFIDNVPFDENWIEIRIHGNLYDTRLYFDTSDTQSMEDYKLLRKVFEND